MFLSNKEIADLTGEPENTIKMYKVNLKKSAASLAPSEMSQEALYGYITMSDSMLEEMMSMYMVMREDFEIERNNVKRTDGKRSIRVQPKDMIALMQTLMKTQLERAAVLSKFAAVNNTQVLPVQKDNKALLNSKQEEIQVEVIDTDFEVAK